MPRDIAHPDSYEEFLQVQCLGAILVKFSEDCHHLIVGHLHTQTLDSFYQLLGGQDVVFVAVHVTKYAVEG